MPNKPRGITRQMRARISLAAGLRVRGKQWPDVAAELGISVDHARHLVVQYREEWAMAYDAAYEERWGELESKARDVLEGLIDDPGEPSNVRQSAAAALVSNSIKLRPQKVEHSGEVVTIVCRLPEVGEVEDDAQDD